MQSVSQPVVAHEFESAGVDWITATAQKGSTRSEMMEFARHQRERFMDAGAPIKAGYRLGYYGWQAEGFFYGSREGGSIVVASGATAHQTHRSIINVADNISRLDLQVTVSTPVEKPNLAKQAYHCLLSSSPAKVKVKNVTYIETHPQGATTNMGKRSSDSYGRIYDKATESGLGAARSRWRYEVELKRNLALAASATLTRFEAPTIVASRLVHEWFDARGVAPIFTPDGFSCPHEPSPSRMKRDVLLWFEQSLSITVAKAVRYHGVERVLESLGLSNYVEVKPERSAAYASGGRRYHEANGAVRLPGRDALESTLVQNEGD